MRGVQSPAALRRQARRGPDARRREERQRGQGMVEYALILVLVAVVVIVALTALGGQINDVFQHITSTLSGADH